MSRLVCVAAGALALVACASPKSQLPVELDPSNPDAAEAPPVGATAALMNDADAAAETGHVHDDAASAPGGQFTCPMHPEVRSSEPGICPKCNMRLVPAKEPPQASGADAGSASADVVYACPMHPEVRSSEAGICPKCNMRLVPAKEGRHGSGVDQRAPDAGTVYVCPMHPEVQSGEPGTCPKCRMKLVPRAPKQPARDSSRGSQAGADAGSADHSHHGGHP